MSPVLMVGGASLLLLMGGGGAALASAGGADRKRVARRLGALTAARSVAAEPGRALSMAAPKRSPGARGLALLQGILGLDPNVPSRTLHIWIACIASLGVARGVVWLATALAGPLGWAAFPVMAFLLVRGYFVWCARAWRNALFQQFPDALATIVRAVRVGVSLPEGIRRVANEAAEPTAGIFRRIADEMAIGTPLHDALSAATALTGLPEYRFFATALILQARTGGGLAVTLEGLADVIRKRVAVKARGKALSGEAKASAAILAILPVVTVVMMLILSPGYMLVLFTNPKGHAVLAAAILTETFGILAMRAMIIRALS